jgi:hypothetical protein
MWACTSKQTTIPSYTPLPIHNQVIIFHSTLHKFISRYSVIEELNKVQETTSSLPVVAADWLAFLFRILKVPGSIFCPQVGF